MSGSFGKTQSRTQIADLRASLKAAAETPLERRPPKPRRAPKGETDEQRFEKVERQAMLQHTTSLLDGGNKSKKPYVRKGERPEKKQGGLLFQLLLVLIVVAGVAWYLDPTLVPQEWTDKAQELIKSWMPA
jgi:hypothetical protein